MKSLLRVSILVITFACLLPAGPGEAALHTCHLVVLSDPADPYYPLAQEIAVTEGALLASTLDEALACQPVYLIWVASPEFLSQAGMVEFGLSLKTHSSKVATGLITASSLEQARQLWQRGTVASADILVAANAPNPAAHIDQGKLVTTQAGRTTAQPLTRETFQHALATASYLTFTGHGSNSFLRLDERNKITPEYVPNLQSLVISTGSCQTFQPWRANNIALRFIDQGAAAYVGFVFSPNEGYLMGEFNGLPFRYTWPDFPIGFATLAQNRGAQQGFAAYPYLHLLGDPRLALQTGPAYQIVADHQAGAWRTLVLEDLPAGIIPIQVKGGAAYRFVVAEDISSAAASDPFYNRRLQMVDIQEDKFLLVEHPGGGLTLRLRLQPPWYWYPLDILLDSLDFTLIFSQQSSGDLVSLGFALLPLVWTTRTILRRRIQRRNIFLAAALGLGAVALQAAYTIARLDQVTIISKSVVFSPLSLLAAFLLVGCGALLYFQSRTRLGRLVGLLVATFTSWSALVVGLLLVGGINLLGYIPQTGAPLYNYNLAWMPAGSFGASFTAVGLTFRQARRWLARHHSTAGGSQAGPLPALESGNQ